MVVFGHAVDVEVPLDHHVIRSDGWAARIAVILVEVNAIANTLDVLEKIYSFRTCGLLVDLGPNERPASEDDRLDGPENRVVIALGINLDIADAIDQLGESSSRRVERCRPLTSSRNG